MLQGSFRIIEGQSPYRKSRAINRNIRISVEGVHSLHEVKKNSRQYPAATTSGKHISISQITIHFIEL